MNFGSLESIEDWWKVYFPPGSRDLMRQGRNPLKIQQGGQTSYLAKSIEIFWFPPILRHRLPSFSPDSASCTHSTFPTSVLGFCPSNHSQFPKCPTHPVSRCLSWCGSSLWNTNSSHFSLQQHSFVLKDPACGRLDDYSTYIYRFSLQPHVRNVLYYTSTLGFCDMTYFGQWDISTHDVSRGLKWTCMLGTLSLVCPSFVMITR